MAKKKKKKTPETEEKIDWDSIVQQIFDMIGTETLIINKYGMVLGSRMKGMEKNKLISPTIWSLIKKREQLSKELGVKAVSSIVLETGENNLVITFGIYIYLMSRVPNTVDLSQYMPSVRRVISTLDRSSDKILTLEFKELLLKEEYIRLMFDKSNIDGAARDSFPIFKHLIKQLSKK